MKTLIKTSLFLALLMAPFTGYAQSVTVDDAGFEAPAVGSILGGLKNYTYNTSTPNYLNGTTGWYVSAGTANTSSVTIVNQGILGQVLSGITNDGSSQYITLNGLVNVLGLIPGAQGGVSQVITTTVGQDYQVTYQAGALNIGIGTTSLQQFSAGVDGVTVTNSGGGGALININAGTFSTQSFTFTATSTQSVLDFNESDGLIANVGGVAIDNVSVTAVPEPSHYTMIFLGCAMVLVLYRKMNRANAFINGEKVSLG